MAITNYTELKTSIAGWLHRTDLEAVIPDFIMLAEHRVNGDLDARFQDKKASLSSVAGQEYVDIPADLINIRHLSVVTNPIQTLTYRSPDQFEITFPSSPTGTPQIYTVIGTKIYLSPVPDYAYELDVVYKSKLETLSDSNPTNKLIELYPHVYLFASLCESAPYIRDDVRLPVWETKYKESVDTVNAQDWYSGSTMIVKTDIGG